MAKIVNIHVDATDNEIYVLAINDLGGSSEICHLKSGMGAGVSYEVNPSHILPPGAHILTVIGINWGGPSLFTVVLTDDQGATTTLTGGTNLRAGRTWSKAVAITI